MDCWPKDAMGRTPLELSVLHDHLPCAVRLLEARMGFVFQVAVAGCGTKKAAVANRSLIQEDGIQMG